MSKKADNLLRHVARLGAAGKLRPRPGDAALLVLFYPAGSVPASANDPGPDAWNALGAGWRATGGGQDELEERDRAEYERAYYEQCDREESERFYAYYDEDRRREEQRRRIGPQIPMPTGPGLALYEAAKASGVFVGGRLLVPGRLDLLYRFLAGRCDERCIAQARWRTLSDALHSSGKNNNSLTKCLDHLQAAGWLQWQGPGFRMLTFWLTTPTAAAQK
jgi:hypothetical protein